MKRLTAFISALLILTLGLPGVAISASNRTTVVGGVWALGAAAPGNNPIAGNTYANDALSESVINDGWPFSQVVNSANFNEFMRRISIILTLAEQWGVLPWSTSTSYTAGALVTGSDNYQYRALQSSAGKDPVSYPDYWALNTSTTPNYALSTGSNNAYAITIPQKNALTSGQPVFFKANFSNTGSATLSVNSQSPVVIKNARGVVLSSGDIPQNAIVMVTYDSAAANYVLISGNVAYLSELAGYALKNGSSSNKFSVANGVSGYDAVNYAQMMAAIAGVTGVDLSAYAKAADVSAALATKAPKGGDANTVFSVANGASGNDAVNYAQMMTAIAGATGTDLSNYPTRSEVSSAIATARTGAKTDVDAEFTGSGMQVKGQSGYQKLPGGVMFQWGVTPVAPGTVNFPTSFSGTPWSVQVTVNNATSSGAYGISATSLSASSFYYKNIGYQNINQAFTSTYFAVGPWQ
jgi:hypothetical protein